MDDVVNLSNDDLREIGVNKLKHRKLIMQEIEKMREGLAASAKKKVSEINVTMHVRCCKRLKLTF